MADLVCIDEPKVFAVIAAGMGADHEQLVRRNRPVEGEVGQEPAFAVGFQGLAQRPAVAEKVVCFIYGQLITWKAAHLLDHLIMIGTESLLHLREALVAKDQVVARLYLGGYGQQEKDPMIERTTGGHGHTSGQPGTGQDESEKDDDHRLLPPVQPPPWST